MSKDIKDYLHLYLRCDVLIMDSVKCRLTGFQYNIGDESKPIVLLPDYESRRINDWSLIKPLLRPLSDMTEEESVKVCELKVGAKVGFVEVLDIKKKGIDFLDGTMDYGDGWSEMADKQVLFEYMNAEQFRILCSFGIDIFGLIESGLAIDKTKTPLP